jgi:excisionase family DNA binding protein
MTTIPKKYVSAQVIAERLGLSTWRVYELARGDLIPHARLGAKQLRFSVEAVDAWIARGGSSEPGEWRQGGDK